MNWRSFLFYYFNTMSSGSLENEPALWNTITCEHQIAALIEKALSIKNSSVIQITDILNAKNGEEWANNILLSMIHNLNFDGSTYGKFWTPDNDIQSVVIHSWSGKRLWVKLLWIKMRVLILQLNELSGISKIQKDRIRTLDVAFRWAFPSKS